MCMHKFKYEMECLTEELVDFLLTLQQSLAHQVVVAGICRIHLCKLCGEFPLPYISTSSIDKTYIYQKNPSIIFQYLMLTGGQKKNIQFWYWLICTVGCGISGCHPYLMVPRQHSMAWMRWAWISLARCSFRSSMRRRRSAQQRTMRSSSFWTSCL